MSYSSPISVTQQCKFCGNPLRIDLYKGCSFDCSYCFSASRHMKGNFGQDGQFDKVNFKQIERVFKEIFDENKEPKTLEKEMIKNKIPFHCGGMSDPFQPVEFKEHLTYKLIELSNKYEYPITFSTKSAYLPEEYFKILNPKLHSFQISCVGFDYDFTKKYELNVDSAENRVKLLKRLHDMGIFTSLRLQPVIDFEQSKKVFKYALELNAIDYATVEHLKIPLDNIEKREKFIDLPHLEDYENTRSGGRGSQVRLDIKLKHFYELSCIAEPYGVKLGAGDNDMHEYTQSRCCCGTDLIAKKYPAFDNYHKYNLTYFLTSKPNEEDFNKIIPEYKNTYEMSFLAAGEERSIKVKDFVDNFIKDRPHLIPDNRTDLKKFFNLPIHKKLF